MQADDPPPPKSPPLFGGDPQALEIPTLNPFEGGKTPTLGFSPGWEFWPNPHPEPKSPTPGVGTKHP